MHRSQTKPHPRLDSPQRRLPDQPRNSQHFPQERHGRCRCPLGNAIVIVKYDHNFPRYCLRMILFQCKVVGNVLVQLVAQTITMGLDGQLGVLGSHWISIAPCWLCCIMEKDESTDVNNRRATVAQERRSLRKARDY